jgi:ectoine hydroxylase-related dioxygenase (phytanoyl-CoA dioxygenase family)
VQNNLVAAGDVEKYQHDGVVMLRSVLCDGALGELAIAVEQNMPWANEYAANSKQGRFFDDYVNWSRFDAYKTHALTGALPQIALELMQTTLGRFFHEHVLVKEAGNNQVTPWHNDDPYYGVNSNNNVSLWVPLDPIPKKIALRTIKSRRDFDKNFIPRRFVDQTAYVTNNFLSRNCSTNQQTSKVLRRCQVTSSRFIFERCTAHQRPPNMKAAAALLVFGTLTQTQFGRLAHGRLRHHSNQIHCGPAIY